MYENEKERFNSRSPVKLKLCFTDPLRLLAYIKTMESDKQLHAIGKTKQSCYAWLESVTSSEERAELNNLHHTDHSACKRKVS